MPQEFALAHAARIAFFYSGNTEKSHRLRSVSGLAEKHNPAAGSFPLIGQLATVGGMSVSDYARQHSLLPVLRVAERSEAPDVHGGIKNSRIVKLVGARLHTDRIHLCCQCVLDDLSHWSFSWYRRTHNLAGIEICAVHGEPLCWVTAPDPLSGLPQHWVDSGEIEKVEFDPVSQEERRFQLRLHMTYEQFLERDRPFELSKIRGILIQRARDLGLRNSPVGSKPTLSDYIQEHAPIAWLRKHMPELCGKGKGAHFSAIDRINTSVSIPGTGFAYAVAFSILFDSEEDASLSLARPPIQPRKQEPQSIRSVYPSEFWEKEYLGELVRMGGNISATAKHLGVDRSFLARKNRSLGIPTFAGKRGSHPWHAFQRFVAGESLTAACAVEGVNVEVVEKLLRVVSRVLANDVQLAIEPNSRSHRSRNATALLDV